VTPRNPRIDAGGRANLADDVRRAAFDLCAAARRLHHLTGDPYFKPRMLAGPVGKDLAQIEQVIERTICDLCEIAGHEPIHDQCGIPEHDLCMWCSKSMPNMARDRP
jgi:hypothetical protein